ncbi:Uncharacterised protein [Klebsiella pneumoniae]|nr:hypothetical protein KP1VIM_02639 [Klebsiella pneumoniae]CAG7577255.1 hypothetical protein KP1VIM_02639 [Klebsiella pneumoniae]CAH1468960.1 Uncharacterised protein [Klebsiella pneumoniae]CAH1471840.1 Uncharacterised protein [Klebsiella pneumoniae]CAH1473097.1 Uncharacterised protein [Klebsiella pneumoniae]
MEFHTTVEVYPVFCFSVSRTQIQPPGIHIAIIGNDSNLLIVFYVQIMPDDFVMQLHRF